MGKGKARERRWEEEGIKIESGKKEKWKEGECEKKDVVQ